MERMKNEDGNEKHHDGRPTLRDDAQSALESFLRRRVATRGDVAQDVCRALRDEASLLFERERVRDALDTDPFALTRAATGAEAHELLDAKKNRAVVERAKAMIRVLSCSRAVTPGGYSAISCVLQLDGDGEIGGIKIRFSFLREPRDDARAGGDWERVSTGTESSGDTENARDDARVGGHSKRVPASTESVGGVDEGCRDASENKGDADRNEDGRAQVQMKKKRKRVPRNGDKAAADDTDGEISGSGTDAPNRNVESPFRPQTVVSYSIDYSVDHGKMESLLGVDVYAAGKHPSVAEAMPIAEGLVDKDCDSKRGQGDKIGSKQHSDGSDCRHHTEMNVTEENDAANVPTSDSDFEEICVYDSGSAGGGSAQHEHGMGDRYGVFVDPDNIAAFLRRANLDLDDRAALFFLLSFPFYEHEWDIPGFLLSVLDEEDEESGE